MYRKILVPLDGSELAECVLPHVELIAGGCGVGSVVFMRVTDIYIPSATYAYLGESLMKEIEENNEKLLEIKEMDFENLIREIKPKKTIGLSRKGVISSYQKVAQEVDDDTCIVVGGFSKGHFSDRIKKYFDRTVSVDRNPLEAHIIISRLLYEYEKRIIM